MKNTKRVKYTLAAIIAILTFLIYLPALWNKFVRWDDWVYIIQNSHIRSLNGTLLKWAFFDFHASNWHPLTWLSHAMDYAIWGLNPIGHHLTNNILHAANTFLVVLLAVKLIETAISKQYAAGSKQSSSGQRVKQSNGRVVEGLSNYSATQHLKYSLFTTHYSRFVLITAGVAGLLFGLHPIHVESVAWVSERKDLLCALFYLLSVMEYLRYAGSITSTSGNHNSPNPPLILRGGGEAGGVAPAQGVRSRGRYILSLCFFTLALMSKPMAVSLPAVLLILDWYPFSRITSFKTFLPAFMEKIPFFALSIGSSILTMLAQERAMWLMDIVPWQARVLVAFRALFVYLGNMLLPLWLSPFYPYSGNVFLLSPRYFMPIILFVCVAAVCVIVARRQRIWLSFLGYYLVTLFPVLGIVQVGRQSMADRYAYLPSLAPFLMAGLFALWVYRGVYESRRGIRLACAATTLCLFFFMSLLTFKQIGIWNNSVDLWSYVIKKEPEDPLAYYGRGLSLYELGRADEALKDYDKAIMLDPSYATAYSARGLVFAKMKQFEKAVADYDKAIALSPFEARTYNNRGAIFEKIGNLDKAFTDYDKVVALEPGESQSYNNRALVFEKMGLFDKAISDYDKAIALNPSDANLFYNRGNANDEIGRLDEAIADYNKAIDLNPRDSQAYNNRGLIFEKKGELHRAIADYDRAIALDPSNSDANNNRLAALQKKSAGPRRTDTYGRQDEEWGSKISVMR